MKKYDVRSTLRHVASSPGPRPPMRAAAIMASVDSEQDVTWRKHGVESEANSRGNSYAEDRYAVAPKPGGLYDAARTVSAIHLD